MSGAISFFLGLFGLGAAGAVNAGQNISQSKKQAELGQIYTARAADRSDADLRQMHERVRKEWRSIPDCHQIAATELCRSDTSSRAPFSISAVEFGLPKHVIPLRDDITGTAFENVRNCV